MSQTPSAPGRGGPRAELVLAPPAPGRIGVPIEPVHAQKYLGLLSDWLTARRHELNLLDAAVLRSKDRQSLTRDMTLSLALWRACQERYELLMATWDSGRVGPAEQQRLSTLIWGRLDATMDPSLVRRASGEAGRDSADGANLAVSLPEACRLSDAMAGQLRSRLAMDPAADRLALRVKQLRAQMERLRDQVELEPEALRAGPAAKVASLSQRVDQIAAKLSRGGDVGGMVGPAEIDATKLERDLIVGGAQRRQARDLVQQAKELRDDLESREAALTQLVAKCVRTVAPSPKYAVPDVAALGPLPNTKSAVEAYIARLQQVGKAMQVVQQAYGKALSDREELIARLQQWRAKAADRGLAENPDLVTLGTLAEDVLHRQPCPLPLARELVEAFQTCVQWVQRDDAASASDAGEGPRR